ncbi:MAG: 5-(carboxyamino)imidazole ribonucleotide mutase [Candidatus Brocadia sp. AMX2]|uniref:N5-carboxyaminoimidazole ribonucleotide mutase n=2 Tax=Candidatus Brocadia TaxID=380240 RepID=A0ABQ0JY07_9BACT|nr:MAG: 5-(carboxyamino)imidazole ribonucleotide mutase [Candidatus Brocadia sp. AMX2]MBC6932584.1 5-(carboxyamino)imidazole ribonucleotide mutase [Candidatus Brocadia sp.]MBL1169868.1 5-(carboxyamino)imidazole ribonucleotide mutase [Candidatus Brocadia sp. AMX1]NOG40624.1 5-(carboxyamino)imidazole ribonucleotide mutase [Planctomycetota bacterium]GAN33576.1 phosphoribosylcarboxyaminoimidazole carboxylase [Candidatus Brocadia sinica JPN1]GIK13405.1 MAG: 5-(carboxyamino)imidazole ribonucleotide 
MAKKRIGIVMGSDSDLTIMKEAMNILKEFDVDFDVNIISAHRSPERAHSYATEAEEKYDVIIAGAGGAAHLAGVVASLTPIPVIGVPMPTSGLGGLDSLLSMVQMPSGIPVSTMAIGKSGAMNAAILAIQIVSLSDPKIRQKMVLYKKKLSDDVAKKDKEARTELGLL